MPKLFLRRSLLIVLVFLLCAATGCDSVPFSTSSLTISELMQEPDMFLGRDVEVTGIYVDIINFDSTSLTTLLAPGVVTSVGQSTSPIYEGESQEEGPINGALWLDTSSQVAESALQQSPDAKWGVVSVSGRFEKGNFGPGGKYLYRLKVGDFHPLQQREWEPVVSLEQRSLGSGRVSFFDLTDHLVDYVGKEVTTQGYYFWSPATSGMLVETISRERGEMVRSVSTGVDPRPGGRIIVLEGFPPELSSKLTIGPLNSYVWGLVEVTGKVEKGGNWGPGGKYHIRLTVSKGQVTVPGN